MAPLSKGSCRGAARLRDCCPGYAAQPDRGTLPENVLPTCNPFVSAFGGATSPCTGEALGRLMGRMTGKNRKILVMEQYEILSIREHPELAQKAAAWFHEKWGIPEEAYLESMEDCLKASGPVPQWFVAGKDQPSRMYIHRS